jgi:hypothetical protein
LSRRPSWRSIAQNMSATAQGASLSVRGGERQAGGKELRHFREPR